MSTPPQGSTLFRSSQSSIGSQESGFKCEVKMSSLMQSQAKFFRTRRSHKQAKKNGQYDDFDLDLDVLPGLLPMSPALEEERLHEYKQLQPLAFNSMCDDAQGRRSSRDDDDAGFAFAGEGKKDAA